MTEIRGKAAVVTGGGSGIGMGLAKELAKQGASVAVADIILENAQKVADAINASGGKAVAVQCDVCDRASIKAMKEAATAALGTIQLVFANAGATSFDALMDMSDDDVDWIIQVNLMGVMNTTRAFLPDMMKSGEGHICATASMAGLLPGSIPSMCPIPRQGRDYRPDDEPRARDEGIQRAHHVILSGRRGDRDRLEPLVFASRREARQVGAAGRAAYPVAGGRDAIATRGNAGPGPTLIARSHERACHHSDARHRV